MATLIKETIFNWGLLTVSEVSSVILMVRNMLACRQTQLRVPDPDPKAAKRGQ